MHIGIATYTEVSLVWCGQVLHYMLPDSILHRTKYGIVSHYITSRLYRVDAALTTITTTTTTIVVTADLRTKILDFRGFDSSRLFISRGGILRSIGNYPEVLSQAILVGTI